MGNPSIGLTRVGVETIDGAYSTNTQQDSYNTTSNTNTTLSSVVGQQQTVSNNVVVYNTIELPTTKIENERKMKEAVLEENKQLRKDVRLLMKEKYKVATHPLSIIRLAKEESKDELIRAQKQIDTLKERICEMENRQLQQQNDKQQQQQQQQQQQ